MSGGAVENAGSKTMGWSGAFRRCFAAAVKDDASFEGVVRLQVIVGPTGDVTDVQSAHAGPMETSPALDAFLECLAAKPFADTFTLSSGDHAVVVLALRFTQETVGPDAPTKGPTS